MKNLGFITLGVALLLVAAFAGCGDDESTQPQPAGTFDSVVSSGGQFEQVQEKYDVVTDPTTTETVGTETYFCTTKHYDIVSAPPDFVLFNPNAGVMWPGNLLQGSTLTNSTPSNIYVRRGPGTVTMTILNGSPDVTRQLSEVSLGGIQQAMNDIISTASDTIPARFQFEYEEVQSWQQLAMSLSVSVSYLTANLGASLAFSTDRQYNRFMVKLNQSFFDMVFDPPSTVGEFFHPTVTPADLDPYIGPGNPAAFIRQVTYGRIFYLLIESTATRTQMDASLRASFSAATAGGAMEAGATYVNQLSNCSIKCFALGGDATAALGATTSDFETLKTFLALGGRIRTGVPLSYMACAVAPPHPTVSVAVATNYDVTNCVPVGESFENPIFWYQATADDPQNDPQLIELDTNNHVTRWNNRLYYDDDGKDAVPMDGYSCAGTYASTAANGKAAVTFALPAGVVGSSLGYSGLAFQDTDYTVVAVMRMVNTQASFPAFCMFGGGTGDERNLKIGFRDDARVTMTTGSGQTLNAPLNGPVTAFNVVTFKFSRTEGMSIYVNLDVAAAATDPALIQPLLGYTGARIGSSNGAQIQIAEIEAYGIAFHDAQRRLVVERLMQKYQI